MTRRVLLGLWTLLLQIPMILPARGPFVFADEVSYVAAARFFGSSEAEPAILAAFAHWGYGLLLAPLTLLFDEPHQFYRAGAAMNAVLLSFAAMTIAWLLETVGTSKNHALIAGFMFGVTPPVLVNSSILWAESALITTAVFVAGAVVLFFDRRTSWSGLVLVLSGAAIYAVHPRGLAVVFAVVSVLLVAAWQQAVPRLAAVVLLAGLAAGVLAVDAVSGVVYDQLYVEGAVRASSGNIVSRIRMWPDRYLWGLLGMAWYATAATLGLFVVGVAAWGRDLWAARFRLDSPRRAFAAFGLIAVVLAWGLGSTVAASEKARIDYVFYGRYLDYLGPFVVAVACAYLLAHRSSAAKLLLGAAAGSAVVGSLLSVSRPSGFFDGDRPVQPLSVLVFTPIRLHLGDWNPMTLGVLLMVGTLIVAGLVRWRPAVALLFVAIAGLVVSTEMLRLIVHRESALSDDRAALAFHAERAAQDAAMQHDGPGRVLIAWPVNAIFIPYSFQYWADDVQFELEAVCATASYDVVLAASDDVRFADFEFIIDDVRYDTSLRRDPSGRSSSSRSLRLAVADGGEQQTGSRVTVEVTNLDSERDLWIDGDWGGPLPADEQVVLAATPLSADGTPLAEAVYVRHPSVHLAPGATTTVELELPAADTTAAAKVRVEAGVFGRGWIADCEPDAAVIVSP